MCIFECFGYFDQLAAALFRSKINSGAYSYRSHIPCFLDRTEHHLVVGRGIGQQFIVVQFDDKRNFMGVFASYRAQNSESGGNSVASAFNGQFDDILRIEIKRIRSE